MILDLYDVVKLLKIGTIVQHKDGRLCTVENFDITQAVKTMPVTYKGLFDGIITDGYLTEIIRILVDVRSD